MANKMCFSSSHRRFSIFDGGKTIICRGNFEWVSIDLIIMVIKNIVIGFSSSTNYEVLYEYFAKEAIICKYHILFCLFINLSY
jgi:hypothetical protein